MFLVLVHHHCKPDKVEAAIARIDSNGDQMAKITGFLFRYRTTAKHDPLQISTVTGWANEASYDDWLNTKATLPAEGESPYLSARSERHTVKRIQ
jgi:heme-degrading monooxygenase HmoA